MNEGEACTIIKNSFLAQNNFCYKIPDPSHSFSSTIKRPFDLMGSFLQKPIVIEVKYQKGLYSFDLQRIEDHQIEALIYYKKQIPDAFSLVMLYVYVKRNDHRVFIFNILDIIERRKNKQNYLKKELETLPYFSVKTKDDKKLIQEELSSLIK